MGAALERGARPRRRGGRRGARSGVVERPADAPIGEEGLRVGDLVVLAWTAPCRLCRACARGEAWLCVSPRGAGHRLAPELVRLHRSDGTPVGAYSGIGTFSTGQVVAAEAAIPIDPGTPPEIAALIGCAVTTGVGAVLNTARVQSGESVVVVGAGGVGLSAIMAAADAGARFVVAVEREAGETRAGHPRRGNPRGSSGTGDGDGPGPDHRRRRPRPRGHRPHGDRRAGRQPDASGRHHHARWHDPAGRIARRSTSTASSRTAAACSARTTVRRSRLATSRASQRPTRRAACRSTCWSANASALDGPSTRRRRRAGSPFEAIRKRRGVVAVWRRCTVTDMPSDRLTWPASTCSRDRPCRSERSSTSSACSHRCPRRLRRPLEPPAGFRPARARSVHDRAPDRRMLCAARSTWSRRATRWRSGRSSRAWPSASSSTAPRSDGSSAARPDPVLGEGRRVTGRATSTVSELGRLLAERWPGWDVESLAYAVRYLLPLVQVTPRGVWGSTGQPTLTTPWRHGSAAHGSRSVDRRAAASATSPHTGRPASGCAELVRTGAPGRGRRAASPAARHLPRRPGPRAVRPARRSASGSRDPARSASCRSTTTCCSASPIAAGSCRTSTQSSSRSSQSAPSSSTGSWRCLASREKDRAAT